jgi:hypothetical protein
MPNRKKTIQQKNKQLNIVKLTIKIILYNNLPTIGYETKLIF